VVLTKLRIIESILAAPHGVKPNCCSYALFCAVFIARKWSGDPP
jgi:hypothetical protein